VGDFKMSMIRGEFDKQQKEAETEARKTIRLALRETAKDVSQTAKKQAPVSSGPTRVGVINGELKKSIGLSKKKDKAGEDYYAKVGPRGQARYASQRTAKGAKARTSTYSARKAQRTYKPHMKSNHKDALYGVMLYRAKMEDRYHYMAAGFMVAEATAGKTAQKSFDKAFERFH